MAVGDPNVESALSSSIQNSHGHLRDFRLPRGNFVGFIFEHVIERTCFGPRLIERDGPAVDAKLGRSEQLQFGRIGQQRLLSASTSSSTALLLLLSLLQGL